MSTEETLVVALSIAVPAGVALGWFIHWITNR